MNVNKFHIGPTNDHVSLELLRQYQADALSPAQQHRVERHLLDCDLCSDILEGMAASPEPVTQQAVQNINSRVAASLERRRKVIPLYADWKNYGVAAAIALFIISGVLVFYYNFNQVKQTQETVAVEQAESTQDNATVLKSAEPTIAQTAPTAADTPENIKQTEAIALNTPKPQAAASPALEAEESSVDMRPNEAFSEAIVMDALQSKSAAAPAAPALSEVEPAYATVQKRDIGSVKPISQDSLANAPGTNINKTLEGHVYGVALAKKENITIRGTASLPMNTGAAAFGRFIAGKVSDKSGAGLPGVSVIIKGTQVGTVTSSQGDYAVALPEGLDKATLVFSFIGYETIEKEITKPKAPATTPLALNIALKEDSQSLHEVVVVGYGTQRKTNMTGAIAYAKPASGFRSFKKYIQANLKYPEAAKAEKVKGRVVVGFTVNPNGTLSDYRIIKSLSPECDAEALRLVQAGPRWEPTKRDGAVVSEQVRISIRFKPPK